MKCPFCGSDDHKVVDKRETSNNRSTRRRRECLKCQKRFTTYERVEEIELLVIKKDESRVPFDRMKLVHGLQQACHKRPVSNDQILETVDQIEAHIRKKDLVEIKSSQIGLLVMKHLKKLDKVAYIRFASVYKQFKDVEELQEELAKLIH